jgi:transcription initiation factor IIE alpha subunit
MPDETRYYLCPNCDRKPHIRYTQEMQGKALEIECEFCLHVFEVDDNTPKVQPDTHPIYRQ